MLKIGTEKGIKEHPVGIVDGVHGLEPIGILILLDFLKYILHPDSNGYLPELKKSKLGIIVLLILNPSGVALKQKSNPTGVDLMRNSRIKAVQPMEDKKFLNGLLTFVEMGWNRNLGHY
ncbi:PF10994 domain protein [Leptospira noguchii serovar Autumnalis str. ZUN142]|uniref:PF10994 domain protein n=1 Tax=Leptospira noguchii serovar Autumnalis str. ZUN142 TaxID=1085540 RepID=M6U853_9LEPT|nr:PF10994 domain protein [Leptospira noguchii serovar Autumnalis str. ZUN142]